MPKQITLDGWLLSHFQVLLKRGSSHVARTRVPLVLYRTSMEEEGESYQETVCTLTDGFVIVQVVTSGGSIPPSFQQQLVFPIEDFPSWLVKKSRDLLLSCVDLLEEQFG
ncbi:MAG TPA: hypothetical protein VJ792_01390 [Candidatus Nitrosotalea sp.]|nr:hypothetical protein [Candidatus Nitrosotalea sp.]